MYLLCTVHHSPSLRLAKKKKNWLRPFCSKVGFSYRFHRMEIEQSLSLTLKITDTHIPRKGIF